MTTESESDRPRSFVNTLLPWILAAGMLAVYLLTLNRWVSFGNYSTVAELSGRIWSPIVVQPVAFVVTYPLRWLPVSVLPLATNLLAAICAALTLGLLARSVSLLPHDRTHEQRLRELSPFSVLTIRSAWLPPVLAVLVCGLQLTFWENSIEGTGEMLDLLIFAYLIRCLLEFRMDQRESWLTRFALVCGLAVAENWAMVGFLPAFLVAVIWIKGLNFFNVRFLLKSLCCWLAGLSLVVLLPLVASLSAGRHLEFWAGLHYVLYVYKYILTHFPRDVVLLLSLTSVLPIFVAGVRWSSFFGDTSPVGIFLATSMFHIVHGLFLVAGIWVALDCPVSPRFKGMGYPFLPFYYLGALGIGYFSGYFLLIFGTGIARSRNRPSTVEQLIKWTVTGCVWLLLIAAPILLIYRNLPLIRKNKHESLRGYFSMLERSLPSKNAVILSDDAFRLNYLDIFSNQKGVKTANLLIDTGSLTNSTYFEFLERRYPQFDLAHTLTNKVSDLVNPLVVLQLLDNLSKDHEIYYLHPSFGYYFERFYLQPHGVAYELKHYGRSFPDAPLPTREEIAENQKLWQTAAEQEFPKLTNAVRRPEHPAKPSLIQRFMKSIHLQDEVSRREQVAASYYSRCLDYWGVQLQRSCEYPAAAKCFHLAQELNPDNVAAQANEEFNLKCLQGGNKPVIIDSAKAIEEKFGRMRMWDQVLQEDGPFDEPSLCYHLGLTFGANLQYCQAIQLFKRVEALAPEQTEARFWLCQLYFYTQDYSNILTTADSILRSTPTNVNALFFKGAALMQLQAYREAIPPLDQLLTLQTNNYAAQLNRAIACLQLERFDDAQRDYEAVAKAAPQAYQAYYGLGEIAYRRKDTTSAIKYCQLYLTNAPANTSEAKMIASRLKELTLGRH